MAEKEIRLQGGKEAYEKIKPYKELANQYGVAVVTITKWREEYIATMEIQDSKPINAKEVAIEHYKDLSNEDLINIIMAQEITIERLKKGYLVKGDGMEKEFMIYSKANAK